MELILILVTVLFVCLLCLYTTSTRRKKRLNACLNNCSSFPLLSRRLTLQFFKKGNTTKAIAEWIEDYNMRLTKKFIKSNFPSGLILLLSRFDKYNDKSNVIEQRLEKIVSVYRKFPRAISVLFGYESMAMHRTFLRKPYSISRLLKINEIDLLHMKLDETELMAIEEGINKVFYLDSHLLDIKPIKSDAAIILKVLQSHDIEYLYHFTHKSNLNQIKELGGLYSWVQLDKMNKSYIRGGGSNSLLSKSLDEKNGVSDYVHLSFCFEHPMIPIDDKDIVILLVHPIVCLMKETLFCNMNATDRRHSIGPNVENLQKVNFGSTKMTYVPKVSKLFKPKQAEVLVKNFIPLKYIINVDFA